MRKQIKISLSHKLIFHMLYLEEKGRVKMVTKKNPGSDKIVLVKSD